LTIALVLLQPTDLLMDDGKRLATYEELSAFGGLEGVDPASYVALAFPAAGGRGKNTLVVHSAPLKVDLYSPEGDLLVSLNERALLHYEVSSGSNGGEAAAGAVGAAEVKDRHGGKEVIDYGEDGTYSALDLFFLVHHNRTNLAMLNAH
jgi:hypothetical protein